MIPAGAQLAAVRLAPSDLLIDHAAHDRPMDADYLINLLLRLRDTPDLDTDPVVAERRGGQLWVTNGRHRVWAYLLAGRETIPCVVVEVQACPTT